MVKTVNEKLIGTFGDSSLVQLFHVKDRLFRLKSLDQVSSCMRKYLDALDNSQALFAVDKNKKLYLYHFQDMNSVEFHGKKHPLIKFVT